VTQFGSFLLILHLGYQATRILSYLFLALFFMLLLLKLFKKAFGVTLEFCHDVIYCFSIHIVIHVCKIEESIFEHGNAGKHEHSIEVGLEPDPIVDWWDNVD
jgi:hypothetical protein